MFQRGQRKPPLTSALIWEAMNETTAVISFGTFIIIQFQPQSNENKTSVVTGGAGNLGSDSLLFAVFNAEICSVT